MPGAHADFMRTVLFILALSAVFAFPAFAVGCSPGSEPRIAVDRDGERCEDFEILRGKDGRVVVGGASFIPLDG